MNRSKACYGSPISPLIPNLFMEEFEVKTLSSCPHPPTLWLRFVADIFVITEAERSQSLFQHINGQYHHIQFTVEEPLQQGTLPFLDTVVTIESNNTFSTTVYRKPTHTDQYLHWDSNHFITAKQSVYNPLACRAKIYLSIRNHWTRNFNISGGPLQACQFPHWALNQLQQKFLRNNQPNQDTNHNINSNQDNNNNNTTNNRNITIVVPYIQGTGERFKKVCKSKGIQVHFKGANTLRHY